jgi:hypothetical protein
MPLFENTKKHIAAVAAAPDVAKTSLIIAGIALALSLVALGAIIAGGTRHAD